MKIVLKLICHFSRSIVLNFSKTTSFGTYVRVIPLFNFTIGSKNLYYNASTYGTYTRNASIEESIIKLYGSNNNINLSDFIKEIKS